MATLVLVYLSSLIFHQRVMIDILFNFVIHVVDIMLNTNVRHAHVFVCNFITLIEYVGSDTREMDCFLGLGSLPESKQIESGHVAAT